MGIVHKKPLNLTIRSANSDDAAEIVEIFNPIIQAGSHTVFTTSFSVEEERAYIANLSPRGIFNVAVDKQTHRIVGFQSMEPFASYTHAFNHVGVMGTYVNLDHHRRGIATCLFERIYIDAKAKGYSKIFTFIRADNQASLTTYQKQGFTIVGTAKNQAKINDKYIDEIIVEKYFE